MPKVDLEATNIFFNLIIVDTQLYVLGEEDERKTLHPCKSSSRL